MAYRASIQCDLHRRLADDVEIQRRHKASKQAHRNKREWLRRAKLADTEHKIDLAYNLRARAVLETQGRLVFDKLPKFGTYCLDFKYALLVAGVDPSL